MRSVVLGLCAAFAFAIAAIPLSVLALLVFTVPSGSPSRAAEVAPQGDYALLMGTDQDTPAVLEPRR